MKDRLLQIRVELDFLQKLEYLRKINGFKTIAETVRRIVEKEWRKGWCASDMVTIIDFNKLPVECPLVAPPDHHGELDEIEEAPTIEPETRWIPCSERLPEDKQEVLVTEYGDTDIGRRFEGRWLDRYGDKMKDVTAWMPLPEPYHDKGRTTTMRPMNQ